jgi:hypothetical protein
MLKIHRSISRSQSPTFTSIGLQRVKAVWFPHFLGGLTHHQKVCQTAVLACADENGDAYFHSDREFGEFIDLHHSELEHFINSASSCTLSIQLPPYPLVLEYKHPEPRGIILCNWYHREMTLPY